jgi:hypothetical protein
MKKSILFIYFIILACSLHGQNEPKKWRLSGYVKDLQTLFFINESFFPVDTLLVDNLIHNRLNFWWYASDQLTIKADLRSRIFYGDFVKITPDFAGTVDNANNDYFDLSLVLVDNPSYVVHTMFDRLYIEYINEEWEIRLGRQRVNWGISTVWNPNDIFNAFNFTDFDYEERPGSDALRVKRYTGFASSIELVSKVFDTWDEAVIAGMWKFHKGSYDIQILGGLVSRDLAIGGGWAGNIGDAGFKGEFTFFRPMDEWFDDYGEAGNSFALTLGADYSFSNSIYLNVGYLYNSNGATGISSSELFNFQLSAKNLYPYRHSIFSQVSYPFTPLLNGSLALIYSPVEVNALFLNPTFTYSIAQNWDLDLVGQISLSKEDRGYVSPVQALFIRFKWSF